jgi:hypothetical protein
MESTMRRPEGDRPAPGAGELRVHPRKRLVLLEEIAADVDAMEDELAARGVPRGQARAAAIGRLYPGPEAARELELEQVAYRRLAARYGGGTLERAERLGLALIATLTTAAFAFPLGRLDVVRGGNVFVLGPTAAVALLVWNTLRVAFGLWVRQDMRARERRAAWRIQIGLVLVAASASGVGVAFEAYATAGRLAAAPDWVAGFGLLRDAMVLAALGLGAVVIGLTGWLALTPSLYAHDAFERRLTSLFAPLDLTGPRMVRESEVVRRRGRDDSRIRVGRAASRRYRREESG